MKETPLNMQWHGISRVKDGVLRYPADSKKAWKILDVSYVDFFVGSRNMRLTLATLNYLDMGQIILYG